MFHWDHRDSGEVTGTCLPLLSAVSPLSCKSGPERSVQIHRCLSLYFCKQLIGRTAVNSSSPAVWQITGRVTEWLVHWLAVWLADLLPDCVSDWMTAWITEWLTDSVSTPGKWLWGESRHRECLETKRSDEYLELRGTERTGKWEKITRNASVFWLKIFTLRCKVVT
jgi:hypothetical protein